ncbi:Ldh family oxidoreductase [Afifella pfennigii]|uniref:Ldh family oxidoreductase n=1 Tax=Afifella pfennigii TaxID=209897 RepID=UPI001FE1ADAC|nr:Ldh family oxidoreductase [Afifella pfennigii]
METRQERQSVGAVSAEGLRAFVRDIALAHGVDAEQAEAVARVMVWAEMVGRPNQGVERLKVLLERVGQGLISCPCRFRLNSTSAATAVIDGAGGFGHFLGEVAMRHAMELADASGVAAVGVRDSNFLAAAGYYANLAAERGMIGFAFSNSFPKVVAHGGRQPVLGTNPLAFAAPMRQGRNLLVDMSSSAAAASSVRELARKGGQLPEGWSVDMTGAPTRDPAEALKGVMLPMAGAKGFSLSLMVEVLAGVLTGAGVSHGVGSMYRDFTRAGDNGHFFIALNVLAFMPLESFLARMDELAEAVSASGAGQEVRLPGAARWQAFEENAARGIELDPDIADELVALAGPHGIRAPWA